MSPLAPTTPLPTLHGLGIHASLARPDGSRAKQYGTQTWLVWDDSAAWIEHEGLRIDVDPRDLAEAANSMASFVVARGHRKLRALTGLLDAFARDESWAAAFAAAAVGRAA